MLMKDDKKKMATLIIAKMGKKPDDKEEMEHSPKSDDGIEEDHSIAMESAGEEIMSALESKSPKALAEAICSLMDLHAGRDSEEDQSSESDDKESDDEQSDY